MARAIVLTAMILSSACSFLNDQVGISSTSGCIRRECRDPDAKDYTRCEAACRQRYQK